jgi:hypothetical protein
MKGTTPRVRDLPALNAFHSARGTMVPLGPLPRLLPTA